MAITRIRTDNIVDSAVTTDKLASQSVTAGKLADNLTYGSDLTVSGDLTVMGTTTTVESTTVTVADPLLVLASGQTGAAAVDAGLVIERGSDTNVAFVWDESADKFVAVNTSEDGSTNGNVTITSYADLEVGTLDASTVNGGNLELTGNTLSATDANGSITLSPDGTGAVIVSSGHELQVADLDLQGIVFAGANGALVTDTDFTFDSATGALAVTGEFTVDNLKLDGNTLSATDANGNLVLAANGTGVIDASAFKLTNLATPTSNSDAATKAYVDGAVSAGGSTISQDDSEVSVTDDGVNPGTIDFVVDGTTTMVVTASGVDIDTLLDVDNLRLDGNTLSSTDANGNITLDPNGTGVVDVQGTLTVSSLTSGRVVYAGASGALTDESGFEYDASSDTLSVGSVEAAAGLAVSTFAQGKMVFTATNGALAVDSDLSYDSATDTLTALNIVASTGLEVGNLTSGRVVLAGVDGALTDDSALAFNAGALTTGDLTLSTSHGTGALTAVSGTFSGLTATRLVFAGTGGVLSDDADMTFDTATNTLSVNNVTSSGDISASSLTSTALTSGRVVLAGTGGELTDDAGLSYDSTTDTLTVGTISVTNLTLDTLDVNVSATVATLTVEDLTAGRVVLAGASGALVDDADLTFNGTTNTLDTPNLNVSTAAVLASAAVSDLTAGSVVLAGASGELQSDAALTFDGTTDTLSATNVTSSGTVEAGTLKGTSLVSGRVALVGANGALTDGSGLTFNTATDTLSTTNVSATDVSVTDASVSSLTSGRVVLAGASGALVDDSGLTFDGATDTLSTTNVSATDVSATDVSVSSLTSGRIVLAGASGALVDDTALTFDGATDTLATTNVSATDVSATDVSVSSLTSGRVVLAGASGALVDDTALTFDGTTDTLATTNVSATDIDTSTISVSSLTNGRVVLVGASGELVDDSDITFSGDTLTATNISVGTQATLASAAVSDLTSGRIVLAGTSGELVDNSAFGYSTGVGTVALTVTGDVAVDNLKLDGNTLSSTDANGNIVLDPNGSGSVDVSSAKITNLATPTSNNDAATKAYVDSATSAINSLTIGDGTATDSVSLGTDTLEFAGTANEIVTAVTDNTVTFGLASDVTIGNDLTVTNDLTVSGDATITGNLTVNGTLTTISTTDTVIKDNTLVLNDGEAGAGVTAGTSGIEIDRGSADNATLLWNETTDEFQLKVGTAFATVKADTFIGDLTGDVTGTVSDISNHDTDALAEGTTNQYFTNARARQSVSASTSGDGNLSYDNATGVFTYSGPGDSDYRGAFSANTSGDGSLSYNSSTGEFTYAGPGDSDYRAAFSASTSGDGSLSYNSATGEFTYAGPGDSDYRAAFSGGTGVSYNSSTGEFSIGQSVGTTDNVTFNVVTADLVGDVTGTVSDISNHDTDDLAEGTTNLYYTDSRARGAISVTDSGGDGSLSYNSSTGVLTYTGPSASDVRAHFSGGTGVDITNGVISIGQAVGSGDSVVFSSVNAGTLQANGLTAGLIVYTGINGVLEAESGFEYNATSNTLTAPTVSATTLITTGVSDGRLLFTSSAGTVTGDAAFTVDTTTDTLIATNISASSGTVTASIVSAGTIKSSGLTAGRVAIITTDGALADDSNLTFDATTDTLSVVDLTASGAIEAGTLAATGLTSGRVVFATAGGELTDDSTFTFNSGSDTLTVTNLSVGTDATLASAKVSDLTSGRVVLAGASGELQDSSGLLFDGGTGALTITGSAAIDNITINGNVISSTDSNGNITLDPNGTGDVDVSSAKIVNLATPTGDYHAATKKYVDDAVSGNVTTIQQNNTSVEVVDTNVSAGVVDFTIDGVLQAKLTDAALELYHSLEVDNLKLDGNTISSTDLNGDIRLAPNGSGKVIVDSGNALEVSDLGVGQIVYVASGNVLATEAGFEYDDSTGTLTAANLEATSALTLTAFTQDNVLFVGANGVVTENSNLTFTGSTLTLTGTGTVTGQFNVDNVRLDGNTVSTTDNNGDLILQPNGTGATVVNSAANSSDFVVKSVNQAGMFVVDASADNIGIKTTTPNAGATLHVNATDSVIIPVGTQAQRPGSGATGMFRFNTTTSKLEVYNGTEWDSIGENQTTNITSETFSGDGSTVNFTLALSMTSASVIVSINGVVQIPGTAYSVSGTTLTFTEAPETGDTIEVRELVTTTLNQTVIGAEDGSSLISYDESGDQFSFTLANNAIVLVTSAGLDLRSGSAIICGDASASVGTTATTVDSFAKADYRVAKYVAQISNSGLGEYQAVELLVVHNGTTATVTEYAEVFTGSASLGSFSATVNGANVEVKFTGANAGNAVKVMPTYIKA